MNTASTTRRQLFNDFEPFQRLPNAPFNITGRPRAMSVDSNSDNEVTLTELQEAIASIKHRNPGRRTLQRRASYTPSLSSINEKSDDEDFLGSLFK